MSYWAVVQTESQREHTVRLLLMRAEYETYMPRTRSKPGKVSLLFPTYVFVRIIDRWYPVRWTAGVSRVIMSGEQPARLEDKIVEAIKRREVRGFVKLDPPKKLKVGAQVRVLRGSFEGQIGIYAGMSRQQRERILLDLLGRKTPVEMKIGDFVPMMAVS
jgi:transcriptional antiterminator RfaH